MSPDPLTLEEFYRRQPLEHLNPTQIGHLLESLAAADGLVTIAPFSQRLHRDVARGRIVEVRDDTFVVDSPDLKVSAELPLKVAISFGYKRKRGFFESCILRAEKDLLLISKPTELVFTNLRRNPRVQVDPDLNAKGYRASMKVKTTVGMVDISSVEIFEISQLGMSIYLGRSGELLVPGDKVEQLEVQENGRSVWTSSGVVGRVDMNRHSRSNAQTYQVILFFRDSPLSEKTNHVVRNARRIPIMGDVPCKIIAEHPLFPGRKLRGNAFEVSSLGFSCAFEKSPYPLISGMRFSNCSIELPGQSPISFECDIAHVSFRSDGDSSQFKCGGAFIKPSKDLSKAIVNYTKTVSKQWMKEISDAERDQLWEFMFETDLMNLSEGQNATVRSKEILETYHRLSTTENPVMKTVSLNHKRNEQLLSAIRFYDRSLAIHHFDFIKTGGADFAQKLSRAIPGFFSSAANKEDVFYLMSFYRPEDLCPAILFGETTKRINDPLKAATLEFASGLYNGEQVQPAFEVSIDDKDAMAQFSSHLIQRNLISFMRACSLGEPSDLKLKMEKTFEKDGLRRERHLLCASKGHTRVFALAEISSVGLNLSELTNSIFVFSEGGDDKLTARLTSALIEKAYHLYFEPHGVTPVVLQPVHAVRARNVNWSRVYICWMLNVLAIGEFQQKAKEVVAEYHALSSELGLAYGSDLNAASQS